MRPACHSSLWRLYYLGGASSKEFATLRNVPKLLFWGEDWARKVLEFSVSLIRLVDEVRAEFVRDIYK